MERLTAAIIAFFILFVIVFLVDYLFIKKRYLKILNGKKKSKKNQDILEIIYLTSKFKLNKNKLLLNKLVVIISIINAFIISLVIVIVLLIDLHVLFQLIIGFILLMSLIYSLYELLGRYLIKGGFAKNEY